MIARLATRIPASAVPSRLRRGLVPVAAALALAAGLAACSGGSGQPGASDQVAELHAQPVVNVQAATLPATADTWVSQRHQKDNFGTRSYLTVRDSRESGLLRFDVPQIAGWTVTSAVLKLNSGRVPGRSVAVYTTSGGWAENAVSWRTAPAGAGLLGTSGAFATSTWVSWNVLPAVPPAGGTVNLRIENASHTWMGFASRESGAATAPQLVVTRTRSTSAAAASTPSVSLPAWTPPATSTTRPGATTTAKPPATSSPNSTATAGGNGPGAVSGWKQTFFDDFSGSSLGPGWGKYLGAIPSMAGGTWASNQVQVQDGKLRLLSSKTNGRWTSGGVGNSAGGRTTYGKYLVRFRMDKAPGVKYALLLWPASGRWPMDGEIDFAEDSGGNRSGTAGTVIWGSSTANRQQLQKHVDADFSSWHTVGVEWTPGKVVFSLDGKDYGTVSTPNVPTKAMNLALQTEAGSCGQWMTCADSSTPAVTALEVDWVSVYTRS